ncbi:copper resistance protein CopC [Paenibacillus barcinonensis]|uniref:Copper resistance protein CopC n=1 Tax=Paenibacillus barcinonensis TaxID=198119 RepID=A0A2V4W2Q5_PAEBA|nr:copper resistance CopC family protein [Paenibacillus barcinonensis]PYE45415.1 hypothetical protein DFQ00_12033 [Paenibacillus barcinonensis]QKS55232.1 copper resistance protein CopC [Paenibacillus barcinonensis]
MNHLRQTVISIICVVLLGLFMLPSNSYAHTKLIDSTPKVDEVVTKELDEITLQFNTRIEMLSTFTLWDEHNTAIALGSTEISEDTMKRKLIAADDLQNGTYRLDWKIVGKDGHPIEGQYTFQVNIPASIQPSQIESADLTPSTKDQNSASDAAASETSVSSAQPTPDQPTEKASERNSSWLPYLLGVIILLIVLWVGLRAAQRRKP